jgi:hypothetical protein
MCVLNLRYLLILNGLGIRLDVFVTIQIKERKPLTN